MFSPKHAVEVRMGVGSRAGGGGGGGGPPWVFNGWGGKRSKGFGLKIFFFGFFSLFSVGPPLEIFLPTPLEVSGKLQRLG